MNITTSWEGLAGFRAALSARAAGLPARLSEAVAETAYEMRDQIQANAPVDTGNLRDSVMTAVGAFDAMVGAGAPYAARIEFGFYGMDSLGRSYNQAPRPYFSTGFEAAAPGFEARVRAALT